MDVKKSIKVNHLNGGVREILVNGYFNRISDGVLMSSCCVNCYEDGIFETMSLAKGDVVIVNGANNKILIRVDNLTIALKDRFEVRSKVPQKLLSKK